MRLRSEKKTVERQKKKESAKIVCQFRDRNLRDQVDISEGDMKRGKEGRREKKPEEMEEKDWKTSWFSVQNEGFLCWRGGGGRYFFRVGRWAFFADASLLEETLGDQRVGIGR